MNTKEKIIAQNTEHLTNLIHQEIKLNGNKCDLNHIDVSNVTNMRYIFFDSPFNGDISQWNVSNVIHMRCMFDSSQFNGDISQWNVSNVTNMQRMFDSSQFNQDISQWNVSNVNNMFSMFSRSQFKGDISNWNIKKVEIMDDIFEKSIHSNIPYWAKYDTQEERIFVYHNYLLLHKLNTHLPSKSHKQEKKMKL